MQRATPRSAHFGAVDVACRWHTRPAVTIEFIACTIGGASLAAATAHMYNAKRAAERDAREARIARDEALRATRDEAARTKDESDRLDRRLLQAQKMEAVGRLAGGIAHDFNNLLTAITGYTELLITSIDPHEPRLQDAYEIRRAALSAARLTKQLLSFSRCERVHQEV